MLGCSLAVAASLHRRPQWLLGEQMKSIGRNRSSAQAIGGLVALACVAGTFPSRSAAQEPPWEFAATSYLWVSAVHAKVSPPDRIGSHSVDVKFIDIFDRIDAVPFVGSGEVRKGRFGVLADLIYLPISSRIDTRNLLFNDGKTKMTTLVAEMVGFYRVADDAVIKADVGIGFRLWSISVKSKLNPGLLPGRSAKLDETFADPIIAVRGSLSLAERWSVTGYFDMGAFDISSSKLTWQLLGTVNYRAANWVDLRLGWRYLAVDRKKIDVDMNGPILGATFRF